MQKFEEEKFLREGLMVLVSETFNNINQIGLKELGNAFRLMTGDKSDNPDALILRQNLHGQEFPNSSKPLRAGAGSQ